MKYFDVVLGSYRQRPLKYRNIIQYIRIYILMVFVNFPHFH